MGRNVTKLIVGAGERRHPPCPAGQLFYQVDSQCRYEAETGLADETITGLNAVRAPEGTSGSLAIRHSDRQAVLVC